MKFSTFISTTDLLAKAPVKGFKAQMALAPKIRHHFTEEYVKNLVSRPAAVLALFYPDSNGETCFLLTLRAQYNGTHSDQISFPGGKFDESDTTLKNTALRETYEEIGIPQRNVKVFKEMTKIYIPPSKFLVSPFLGTLDYTPTFIKNHEVKETISVKLKDLLDDKLISTTQVSTSNSKKLETPCFIFNNHIVWGATAMILNEIRELLKEL